MRTRQHWRTWRRAVRRRWGWVLLGIMAAGVCGFAGGYRAGCFTATVELLDPMAASISSPPGSPVHAPLAEAARSAAVRHRVVQAMGAGGDVDGVASRVLVTEERGLIRIRARHPDAQATMQLAQQFAEQTLALAPELEAQRQRLIAEEIAGVDRQLADASQRLTDFQLRTDGIDFEQGWAVPVREQAEAGRLSQQITGQLAVLDLKIRELSREIARLDPALVAAKDALTRALMVYREEHPKVKQLRSAVASLEQENTTGLMQGEPSLGTLHSPEVVDLYTRLTELKGERLVLVQQLEDRLVQGPDLRTRVDQLPGDQTEQVRLVSAFAALKERRFALARLLYSRQSEGTRLAKLVEPPRIENLSRAHKWRWGVWSGMFAGLLGAAVTCALAGSLSPKRIDSEEDLLEATELPLLASLGDLQDLTEADRQEWAWRTFTRLRGSLDCPRPLILGFTSADRAEGRSTWIRLLAEAAERCGHRVIKVSALRSDVGASEPLGSQRMEAPETEPALAAAATVRLPSSAAGLDDMKLQTLAAPLSSEGLEMSALRSQWNQAVSAWEGIQDLVVLVELPPASEPEALLLAEGLPHVIWLSTRGAAGYSRTRVQVRTLRHGRIRLAGCVFNRAGARGWKQRWSAAMASLLLWIPGALAQQPQPDLLSVVENAPAALSVSAPERLAPWQQRLTLGPGDVFDISLYEQPESLRQGLAVGPDGRINYQEAQDIMAAGLTVDELRERLEEILARYHRAPRIVINPRGFNSKKYYVLGHVKQTGVFALDRPVTVIEAIARAGGFVNSVQNRRSWVQADLGRSFLVRRGTNGVFNRVAVDFEGLFMRGELGQNVSMAPDDYVFFPPLDVQEVYVLGEVKQPGVVAYTPETSAIQAIAARGGFTERAYRARVLIVRGSLNHPQALVLNVNETLKGRGLDQLLQNHDIIYIHEKPWARAQELLEQAVFSFVYAAVVAYAGQHIGPFITEPIIK